MKVWVIMGNDYPDCVFANEESATAYVERKKAEHDKSSVLKRRIYWRFYEYEVQP